MQRTQAEDANPVAGALAFTKDPAPDMVLSEVMTVYTQTGKTYIRRRTLHERMLSRRLGWSEHRGRQIVNTQTDRILAELPDEDRMVDHAGRLNNDE